MIRDCGLGGLGLGGHLDIGWRMVSWPDGQGAGDMMAAIRSCCLSSLTLGCSHTTVLLSI